MSDPSAARRPKPGRSPSYPAIPIGTAIKRARELYDREGKHPAPIAAVVGHWGYSPSSSGGKLTVAALKKFGLIDDDGSGDERSVSLTPLGLDIVLNPDPRPAIQQAALLPKAHRELWDEYGPRLPSDATLIYKLVREGFTQNGAVDFLLEYKTTLAFSGLDKSSSLAASQEDEGRPGGEVAPPPSVDHQPPLPPPPGGTMTTIPILLPGAPAVQLTGQFPITPAAWDHMMKVLEVMKSGMVVSATDAAAATEVVSVDKQETPAIG
jgi:hypothetical protein